MWWQNCPPPPPPPPKKKKTHLCPSLPFPSTSLPLLAFSPFPVLILKSSSLYTDRQLKLGWKSLAGCLLQGVVSMSVAPTVQQGQSLRTHTHIHTHTHTHRPIHMHISSHSFNANCPIKRHIYHFLPSLFVLLSHSFTLTKAAICFQLRYNSWAVAYICYPPSFTFT